jgi:hypothetical protein
MAHSSGRRQTGSGDANQLHIEWNGGNANDSAVAGDPTTEEEPIASDATAPAILPPQLKMRPSIQRRALAVLPIPRPLPSAIAAGHFGQEEDGRPVRPGAAEVRAITENHAEKLVDLLDSIEQAAGSCVPNERARLTGIFDSAIAAYAEDFGPHAANQLEAYVRRQASLDASSRLTTGNGWHR